MFGYACLCYHYVSFLADNVPTVAPTAETPHTYLSADPLTTENSAYGLGDSQQLSKCT